MPHSYSRVWIHAVWATKQRTPFITSSLEEPVYEWMRREMSEMSCPLRIINGMPDHVHLLFRLNPKLTITDVLKQVKGSTSHWINERGFIPETFDWQTGYGAFSVSESKVTTVYEYIRLQKEHHQRQDFAAEFEWLVRKHGMIY